MSELSRDDVVEAARRVQAQVEGPLTRRKFIQISGISEGIINRLFPIGRWTEIRDLAGILRHPFDRREYSDDELLLEFHRVVEKVGQIPTWAMFNSEASVYSDTLRRRFGGLQGTLRQYADWLKRNQPASSFLDLVQRESRHEIPAPPQPTTSGSPQILQQKWKRNDSTMFGPPIDFRGLRHAPINEQGVVYLFGIVSYELGFIVEAVHAAYPDCEAKRQVSRDRWQRVRIEFEFKSSNFRDHGHDPTGADLVVCWEHNWPECPIEVLELRQAIDELED